MIGLTLRLIEEKKKFFKIIRSIFNQNLLALSFIRKVSKNFFRSQNFINKYFKKSEVEILIDKGILTKKSEVKIFKDTGIVTKISSNSNVQILKDKGIVVKKFKNSTKKFRTSGLCSFRREKECLRRLEKYNHFPKIIKTSEKDLTIVMTYCGDLYDGKRRKYLISQTRTIVKALENERIFVITPYQIFNSILINNGILNMIDFEDSYPLGAKKIKNKEEFISSRMEKNNYVQLQKELELLILGKFKNQISGKLVPEFSPHAKNYYVFRKKKKFL